MKKGNSKTIQEGLYQEIDIPNGIEANVSENIITIESNGKKMKRNFVPIINIRIKENKIIISANMKRKKERKLFFSYIAHIKNMLHGLEENFEYKLKISNVHFPMNASFNKEKREFVIKNFLGEKKDRTIKIIENVEINIKGDEIIVSSYDIEKAGRTAADIEKCSKVRNFDRRVYQDGIFIIEKPRRSYMQ
jgi:large subunit ribosomal protein L6